MNLVIHSYSSIRIRTFVMFRRYAHKTQLCPSTWQHLPPEITYFIADFVLSHPVTGQRRDKGGLTGCAVVCRYWAQAIRPQLFESITLRGLDDVDFLLKSLKSPPSIDLRISGLIRVITYLKADDHIPPWLRLSAISRLAPSLEFHIECNGDGKSKQMDGCSILRCFPRTLPPSAFISCASLRLYDIHFRNKKDRTRIIQSFIGIKGCSLVCINLSFHTSSALESLRLTRCQYTEAGRTRTSVANGGNMFDIPSPKTIWAGFPVELIVASTMIAAKERLPLWPDAWMTVLDAVIALVPAYYHLSWLAVRTSTAYSPLTLLRY